MVRRAGQQILIFKSEQEPSIVGLKNKVVAELGGSHDVILEPSNGVVEQFIQLEA